MADLEPYDHIVSKLQGLRASGDNWTARCPAHEDNVRSLSISIGNDGRLLVNCHAGTCSFAAIAESLGAAPGDFFPQREGVAKSRIVRKYAYFDETKNLLYQVCRFEPKSFRQRRPDGHGGWVWNLDGVRRVLYRLPEIVAPENRSRILFLVEGEKDAERLAGHGLLATTMCGGAAKWRNEYNRFFKDRHVVILPDNDPAGEKSAGTAAKELNGVAASVKVLRLPGLPERGDVSDWLDAGQTVEQLQLLVRGTKPLGSIRRAKDLAARLLDELERV